MDRVLVVTNDFPPRDGGIERYVYEYARRLGDVVVLTSSSSDGAGRDQFPFPVVRMKDNLLLPTQALGRQARGLARAERCTAVWFGAAAPLALLARQLRDVGPVVASTHGHEVGWTRLPVARSAIAAIGRRCTTVTDISDFTRRHLQPVLGHACRLERLPGGVDHERFRPDSEVRSEMRARLGLADDSCVVLCVSRLVARKGQDILIRAFATRDVRLDNAILMIAGTGPDEARLRALATSAGISDRVRFLGRVTDDELPSLYGAADVFAMPCRSRHARLDVEGLGVVYLEAAASRLPVIAGSSGGAPEAVRPGTTGCVSDGHSVSQLVEHLGLLIADPDRRRAFGDAGRRWVQADFSWDNLTTRLRSALRS